MLRWVSPGLVVWSQLWKPISAIVLLTSDVMRLDDIHSWIWCVRTTLKPRRMLITKYSYQVRQWECSGEASCKSGRWVVKVELSELVVMWGSIRCVMEPDVELGTLTLLIWTRGGAQSPPFLFNRRRHIFASIMRGVLSNTLWRGVLSTFGYFCTRITLVVNLQRKTWTQFEYLLGFMDATRHLNCAHFKLGSSISLYFTVLGRCMHMSKVSSLDFFPVTNFF